MDVNSKNGTATALRVMGVAIIVVGTCGSISLSTQMYDSTFWFWVGTLSSVFTGLLVIGLSEIIAILHESREYLKILSSTKPILSKQPENPETYKQDEKTAANNQQRSDSNISQTTKESSHMSIVFESINPTNINNSPFVIQNVRLEEDDSREKFARVTMTNNQSKTVSAVTVGFKLYDPVGPMNDRLEFRYSNICLHQGESFGGDKLVRIRDSKVKRIGVVIKKVEFEDGSVWPEAKKKTTGTNDKLKHCPNCGAPIGEGASFCQRCGMKL